MHAGQVPSARRSCIAGRWPRRAGSRTTRTGPTFAVRAGPGSRRLLSLAYGKLPEDAQELLKKSPVLLIAADLDRQARLAKERGAPPGERVGSWPWPALAAMLIPAVVLLIVVLAR